MECSSRLDRRDRNREGRSTCVLRFASGAHRRRRKSVGDRYRHPRQHARTPLDAHPMRSRIDLLEGSSVHQSTIKGVANAATRRERVLVVLDSNHTHDHVLEELRLYSRFVTKGSYLVVLDTIVEDMREEFSADRPWGPGNNPHTAVHEFLETSDRFEIDRSIGAKLQITVARDGYLRSVKD